MDLEIVHADTLEIPVEWAAEFGAMITDPPYSEHVHANATSVGVVGGEGMGVHERDLGFEHLSPELRLQIARFASYVARWSVLFSDHEGTHLWRRDVAGEDVTGAGLHVPTGAEYIRMVPWIRWSQAQLSGDRPCTGSEAVLAFHRQYLGPRGGTKPIGKWWNGPGSLEAFELGKFERRAMRGKEKHPTEKPLDLMLDLVSWFSDPGEIVFDPCAGAGTTGLACRLLGRGHVGIERDAEWARQASTRLGATLSDRDRVRASEWVETSASEARSVPEPRAADGSDVKTWERAQRRLEDVYTVANVLGLTV